MAFCRPTDFFDFSACCRVPRSAQMLQWSDICGNKREDPRWHRACSVLLCGGPSGTQKHIRIPAAISQCQPLAIFLQAAKQEVGLVVDRKLVALSHQTVGASRLLGSTTAVYVVRAGGSNFRGRWLRCGRLGGRPPQQAARGRTQRIKRRRTALVGETLPFRLLVARSRVIASRVHRRPSPLMEWRVQGGTM